MSGEVNQYKSPNFVAHGKLYLVRCFACDAKNGKENYAPIVATGRCAWCGWPETKKEEQDEISSNRE